MMVGVLALPSASTALIAFAAATSGIAAADYLAFFLRNLALFQPGAEEP
jgi:hypothetical protein